MKSEVLPMLDIIGMVAMLILCGAPLILMSLGG